MTFENFGLVLSGGGARGAYEAGVVKFLAEQGLQPSMISGANIGSFNGAVLAAASDIQEGAKKLESLWRGIDPESVLKLDSRLPLQLLIGMLLVGGREIATMNPALRLGYMGLVRGLSSIGSIEEFMDFLWSKPVLESASDGILDNRPIMELLEQQISLDALNAGIPLWISVYPSQGLARDLIRFLAASWLGIGNTDESHYFRVQDLAREEQIRVLLASAALPLAYESQWIDGRRYVDGGVGNTKESKGNTPLVPLVEAGIKRCIVVHLSNGSFWDRYDGYQDVEIIEVRPRKNVAPEGFTSTLNFNLSKIAMLIDLGYEDAKYHIGNALTALNLNSTRKKVAATLQDRIQALEEQKFAEAIRRLKE